MFVNNSEYLCHYGIVGMKWGQRRLQKRIANAKAIGNTDKVKKLKERYDQNESITKMNVSDKLFLSREGVLANQRLMKRGESKVNRMIQLHGTSVAVGMITDAGSKVMESPFKAGLAEGKHQVANSLGVIGANVIASFLGAKARDAIYKKIE